MVGGGNRFPQSPSQRRMMAVMTKPVRIITGLMAGVALLGSAGTASAAGTDHGKPVIEPAPAHPPAASERNGSCVVPTRDDSASPPQDPSTPLVWVRSHPTGVVMIWLPGLNAKKCVARRTVSGAALAGRVAAAVRHAGAFPNGALPCPYADGTEVQVYLRYQDQRDEYAVVTLNGCRAVSAPSRHARWSTTKLQRALRKAAPAAWRSYLAS